MESGEPATDSYPLHLRYRWKHDWFCGKKDHEPSFHSAGLALGNRLHTTNNCYLAAGRTAHQHSFWTIFFFFPLYPEDWYKVGLDEA